MKVCLKCNVNKSLDSFHKRKDVKDGRQAYCKPCRKEVSAKAYKGTSAKKSEQVKILRARNLEEMRSFKSKPCADCGGSFHFAAMQFDHLPGFKKLGNVSMMLDKPIKMREEIAKCEVVCANCHAIRTYNRRK